EFGGDLRFDIALWRGQLAYALPFALAVGVDVVQANVHQWVVATRFDAATFAIYAVGCLQIPLVDLVCTSTANVMMVKMAETAFAVDAVLRVYAQTRFLFVMNAVRLAVILASISWFLSTFGLIGGVLVTLVSTSLVKAAAVVRVAGLLNVGLGEVLPWRKLGAL